MLKKLFVTFILTALSGQVTAVQFKTHTKDDARKEAFKKDQRTKIICVGDSATFGFGADDIKKENWPMQLQGMLDPKKFNVVNYGINVVTVMQKG